jgi:putative DNA primase/helicase
MRTFSYEICVDAHKLNGRADGSVRLVDDKGKTIATCSGNLYGVTRAKFCDQCAKLLAQDPEEQEQVRADVDAAILSQLDQIAKSTPSNPRKLPNTDWNPEAITQLDNARRVVELLDGNAFFLTSQKKWFCFDGTRNVIDEKGYVDAVAKRVARETLALLSSPPDSTCDLKAIDRHAVESNRAAGIAAMKKLAETEPGIPVAAAELDADPWLLNVLNGTVDLRTGELRPHQRADRMTKLAPVEFDSSMECHAWDAFLERVMDGNQDLISYLQRLAGLFLTSDISVQEFWIFFGGGANGKSVFLDTLTGLMGDYSGEAAPSLLTTRSHDEHPTEIADLAGKRLVVGSETEENARLRVQLVKQMTGNAWMKGRFMRGNYFQFPRTHKTILVTNNRPVVREASNAVWRRIRIVPFTVTIPKEEQDPKLLDKLKLEWPGILNWAIAGCLEWQRAGMNTPEAVKLATAAYEADQDLLTEYLVERCSLAPNATVPRKDIYSDYLGWAKRAGEQEPMGKTPFYDRLRCMDGIEDTEVRLGGKTPVRVFRGICLKGSAQDYAQQQAKAGVAP